MLALPRRDLLTLPILLAGCEAPLRPPPPAPAIGVAEPADETGEVTDSARRIALRDALIAALRRRGHDAGPAVPPGIIAPGAPIELHVTLVQRRGPGLLPTAMHEGSLAVARLRETDRRGHSVMLVVQAPPGGEPAEVAEAVVAAVAPRIGAMSIPSGPGLDITATGRRVRHLGNGRFLVGEETVDLRALAHAHDRIADWDVPDATDITLQHAEPTPAGLGDVATITLYHVDPPLVGLPSRQAGIDRSIDFRDPSNLVKSAYSNIVSIVRTEDAAPVPVASHPIGHFFVRVEVPGFPTLLTGMTTIRRSDMELLDLTIGRELGIGGVLLTPQPGRLNASAEAARELALRQRRLRIVDGLYFRQERGRNLGPEYLRENGNVVFARVRVPLRNGMDAMACFAELVARGIHNRFGSLLNRTFRGTGAGCAAFAMSWLQAAGVIPFVTEPPPGPAPSEPEALGPLEFWRVAHAGLRIPWEHLGCDERVGAAQPQAARFTVYDLLLHGERQDFIQSATAGLIDRLREQFGFLAAPFFEVGIQTPLRGIAVVIHRRDPFERGRYSWDCPGLDLAFWDNARFSAWIRRVWEVGSRHPKVRPVREGRFLGLEIDATAAPRQAESFFAAADRRDAALRAERPPAMTCEAAFAQGLE